MRGRGGRPEARAVPEAGKHEGEGPVAAEEGVNVVVPVPHVEDEEVGVTEEGEDGGASVTTWTGA